MFDCLVLPKVGGNTEIKLRFSFGENLKIRLKNKSDYQSFFKKENFTIYEFLFLPISSYF